MFPGTFWTRGRISIAGSSRLGEVAWHSGLYGFQTCVVCHEVSHRDLFANIPSLPFILLTLFFQPSPKIYGHRWGSEQKQILKLKALRSLKSPVSQPLCHKAHAELRLLYQSVHRSICSDIRHSWIPFQGAWTSPPAAVFFRSLAGNTALGVFSGSTALGKI